MRPGTVHRMNAQTAPPLPDQFHDLHLVLLGVAGSTAYGLAGPTSDIDRLGVYLADTHDVLGLHPQSVTNSTITNTDPDVAVHELGKFARLALKANPTVLEVLYMTTYETLDPIGQALIDHRTAFLATRTVRDAYIGYATTQAKRLAQRHAAGGTGFANVATARTAKHARHCLRLLNQGEQLLTTGTMRLHVGDQRDELFTAGQLAVNNPAAFADLFGKRRDQVEAVKSVLPDLPDTKTVTTLVRNARIETLHAA